MKDIVPYTVEEAKKANDCMTKQEALQKLDSMQCQIIHGSRIFGDIADVIRTTEQLQKELVMVLGQFVDLSVKPARTELRHSCFRCSQCQAWARTPPELCHRVGCVVVRARDLLNK